jgi:peptide/nickel transport system permease protein
VKRYFTRKVLIYLLTFFIAVTIDWMIPRFMPGDPVLNMLAKAGSVHAEAQEVMYGYLTTAFGLDLPIWQQYFNFWKALFHGDLGVSVLQFPRPVADVIKSAIPYDLLLLIPSIVLSWIAGNKFGAFAARSKKLDNTILPVGYILTATPYMWLGILLGWVFAIILKIFPISGAFSYALKPAFTWTFIKSVLQHWFLPFASLFIVQFGGWAIGMRNMIIYELEADYAHYLEALGAPKRLIRKYAYNNALLPQLSGLALKLGVL